jgi:4-amino-4-deoxy-L-arabinose transferase-like glycosyltransferase
LNAAADASLRNPSAANTVPRLAWWLVILLFLLVWAGSAFSPGLQDDADSTHAEAAREMYVTGNYVTLHVNGIRYLEKAPLPYWLVAGSYHVFGVNEFSTHLPTLLAIFGLMMLAMLWAKRAFGERAGIYAGLFVCTTAGFFLFTRILIPEAILSFFIALSLYWFLTGLEQSQESWRFYGAYACMAAAVLTKGLFALVAVVGPIVFYLALTGQWRRWREFRILTGLLLFFALAAPWHILAGLRNPRFFWFYFVNEHFLRFLGKRYPVDYNKLPASLYWLLHLVWLFPWSLYLPLAIRRGWKLFRRRKEISFGFAERTELLCWLWASVILVFFSLSTNQEYYTFPAYFPFVLLLANAIASDEHERPSKWLIASAAVLANLSLIAAAVLAAGLWNSRKLPYVSDIGSVLAQPNLSNDTLSMGHMLDLTGPSFAALRLPAILAMIVLALGPAAATFLRIRRKQFAATVATAITMAVFLIAAHIALERFDPFLGSRDLARAITRVVKPQDEVMIYGDQAFGSSLLFYLQRRIDLVNGRTTSMWFGSTYPDAPHIYLTDGDLLTHWNSGQRVFLFVPEYAAKTVDGLLGDRKFAIAEGSGKVIYSNRR